MPLDLLILCADVVTGHPSSSAGGLVQSCQHVHSRCLARPIGTEKTENLSSLYAERDVINGMEVAKGLDQVLYLDDRFCLFFDLLVEVWLAL